MGILIPFNALRYYCIAFAMIQVFSSRIIKLLVFLFSTNLFEMWYMAFIILCQSMYALVLSPVPAHKGLVTCNRKVWPIHQSPIRIEKGKICALH